MVRIRHLIDIYDNDKILNDIYSILELIGNIANEIDVADNLENEDYRYINQLIVKSKNALERAYSVIKL